MVKGVTAPLPPIEDEITAQQAAEIAGVDSRTIRRWVDSGLILGRQLSGGPTMPYLVSRVSLLAYLELKKSAGQSSD